MSTNLTLDAARELTKNVLVDYISQQMYDADPNKLTETYSEDDWEDDDFDLVTALLDTAQVELVVSWN